MWIVVCCDLIYVVNVEDRKKGFLFGYIGENKEDGVGKVLSVS